MAIKDLSGGDKLEATLKELSKKARNAATLKVGFQNGATYPDGTLVAMVAMTNEFGVAYKKQPPRPFFRIMIKENVNVWGAILGAYLDDSGFDAKVALDKLGEDMHGQLIDSIRALTEPKLSPVTIAKKGFEKPLIETDNMWNSITSVVE